jgi:AraC-like DNA-binding protein
MNLGTAVFSPVALDLSFFAMIEHLELPAGQDGRVVRHLAAERVLTHCHAELEVNLVVAGTATYLLGGKRRYELSPGTLTWLFPAQEHVLVNRSADHELWWAVFTPSLVARIAGAPHTRPLLEMDPAGSFSRRLGAHHTRRLQALFDEVHHAEIRDDALANAGLAYLLTLAWRTFLDSDEVVDTTHVHPAISRVVELLRTEPSTGALASLARIVGLSPTHLSRLFKAQTGVSLSHYRNQQRLHRFMLAYSNGNHITAMAAALAAGFGSYAQFYRVFRQETGHGPATLCTPPRQARHN